MKRRFTAGYHPGKPGLEKVLGSLESEIMEIIWRKGEEVSVRDVLEVLQMNREVAYTTVMTIMGRLAGKRLLEKRKSGNSFLFRPTMTREDFTEQIVGNVLDDLLADFGDAALAHLVHRAHEQDRAVVEKLERMLAELKEKGNGDTVE